MMENVTTTTAKCIRFVIEDKIYSLFPDLATKYGTGVFVLYQTY